MKPISDKTILVTGASGKLARRVVELLLDAGAGQVIAGTRTPEKAAGLRERGAQVRRVDFEDSVGLKAAFAGVDRILIVSTDAVAEPGRRLRQHQAAIEAATKAQAGHLFYTSFTRSEADSPIALCVDHHGTEQSLRASGLAYTALRNSLYAESLLRRVPAMLTGGELVGAVGGGGVAYVAREDCARAAAAALASETPPIGEIEITGPEVISGEQLTRMVSEITGKTIRFVGLDPDALINDLVAGGMSKARAASRVSFDIGVASGYLGFTTDAIAELTGRPPTHARDFLISAGVHSAAVHNVEKTGTAA